MTDHRPEKQTDNQTDTRTDNRTDIRPNILVICTDQQHWQMMSCAGNPHLHTPAMDRLAAEGTRFTRAYCAYPVCVPSRFTMFTGQMPSAIGMAGNRAPHADQPLPESIESKGPGWLLQQAGYRCLYAGKQHLPRTNAERLGFELMTEDDRDECADTCADFVRRSHDAPYLLVSSLINPHDICYMAIRDSLQNNEERNLVERGQVECEVLDQALQRPAGVDEETFFAEHCPPLPPNVEPQADEPQVVRDLLNRRPFRMRAREQWSDRRWREHRWAYARLTEFVDRQVGRILDAVDESESSRDTVVIFLSDHGDMDASHRMEHKNMFYEEAARVPLIVRHPDRVPAGVVDDRSMINTGLDLIPTLCDYADIAAPRVMEGRSFRPVAEGRTPEPPRSHVKIECEPGHAIVTAHHKYVRCNDAAQTEQLFDLVRDPHEMRNAAHDAEHQDTLAELRALFDQAFNITPAK